MMHTRKTMPEASPSDSGMGFSPAGVPLLLMSLPHSPRLRVYRCRSGTTRFVTCNPPKLTRAERAMDHQVRASSIWQKLRMQGRKPKTAKTDRSRDIFIVESDATISFYKPNDVTHDATLCWGMSVAQFAVDASEKS